MLADADPETRRAARRALTAIGREAVEPLVRVGLPSEDWEVPALAIAVLGDLALRGAAGEAIAALLRVLADPRATRTQREHAALALGKVKPVEMRVREALLAAVHDASEELAMAAVEALGWQGPEAEDAIPELLALLAREDQAGLEREIIVTLGRIGRRVDLVAPALLHRPPQRQAAWAEAEQTLASYGKSVLPALAAALAPRSGADGWFVAMVLERLGPEGASLASALVAAMARDEATLVSGANALGAMGAAAAGVVPDVVTLVTDAESRDEGGVHPLILALARMGPLGWAAVLKLLSYGGVGTRCTACRVLAYQGQRKEEARARLTRASKEDPDDRVRDAAVRALAILEPR